MILAYVKEDTKTKLDLHSIPILCEFPDVFPDELLGLPLDQEIEFLYVCFPVQLLFLKHFIQWFKLS